MRYYAFENVGPSTTEVPNLAQRDGALKYQVEKRDGKPVEPLRVVAGRWPGKQAVRIDAGFFAAASGKPTPRGFTVEAWIRLQGPGKHPGNSGATNGTLLALGSGYWDGWRLTTGYPERTVRFEIGRPKPSHSIGVAGGALAEKTWQHVATVWDGHAMRIYVDGLPAGNFAYDGAFTMPSGRDAFRIGFANSGVGSVAMDVDEAAVYDWALPSEVILQHAFPDTAIRPAIATRWAAAAAALFESVQPLSPRREKGRAESIPQPLSPSRERGRGEGAVSLSGVTSELQSLLREPGLSADATSAVRRLLAESLCSERKHLAAGAELAQLIAAAGASDRWALSARARLLRLFREVPGAAWPPSVMERILTLDGITPIERSSARLAMGHSQLAAGQFAAARAEYETALAAAAAPLTLRSLAQLHIAQSFAAERNFAAARAEYAKMAAAADAPTHHRWEAEQQIAAIGRMEAGQPARDPAASRRAPAKLPEPGATLYVATTGNDANPGTRERPLATLEGARDAIRREKLAAKGPLVLVGGGEYRVRETFTLTADDSGAESTPVVYRAASGETPRFTGGVRLRGFQPVKDAAVLERLAPEARAKILALDLKPLGLSSFPPLVQRAYCGGAGFKSHPWVELFCNGRAMPVARWPNEGFVTVSEVCRDVGPMSHNIRGSKIGEFLYEGDRPARWVGEKDALLYGYWFWSWADSYERVAAIDPNRRQITLAPPYHRYGYRKGQPYYALNLLCEIDQPGEWVLDRQSATLYFYPPCDVSQAEITLSTGDTPFVRLENASHVRFEGLTWEYGRADGLVIKDGRDCLLAGCTVRHFAGNGVDVQGGLGHGLLSCDIHSMGRGGVRLSGGNRKTLAPSGHFVENCHIYDLSRLDHTYTPAVWLTGVGARITHNLMHDIPSSAINLAGNDHLVELNEVFRVVRESDDQGGIDMFGNPTYRGNVFRYNYWHHIGKYGAADDPCGQAGIRLDDAICGVVIYGNVFFRSSSGKAGFGGVQIHGGKDNIIDNNLFVDCTTAVSFSPWGPKRWAEHTAKYTAPPDIDQQLYRRRYPALARLTEDPDANTICRSLVCGCGEFLRRDRGRSLVCDNLSTDDAGFVDRKAGDFSLRQKNAALAPIPFAEMGLYRDAFRRQLPDRLVRESRAAP